jgi:glyoxylase-like metal-dependent hydrolase (beta-lactamase superfamily II)
MLKTICLNLEMPKEKKLPPSETPQPTREIAPGMYQIQLPLTSSQLTDLNHINVYLVEGINGWLLIDTGWHTPNAQTALETALVSLKLTLADIRSIIITHCHPDHFGLAGKIKALFPKTIISSHIWESSLIESRYVKAAESQDRINSFLERHGVPASELRLADPRFFPIQDLVIPTIPDQVLYGGEVIHTGIYDLEVIWTPGHSPGHVCLYEPQNQYLFCGDHILPSITPNVSFNLFCGDDPLGDYIYSLNKFSHLSVAQVHPGHEYSFADMMIRIKVILEHHREREEEIRNIIRGGLYFANDIASHLKWNLPGLTWQQFPPIQKRFAVTETIAHLEHLRWTGRLQKVTQNNRIYYGPV